MARKGLKGLLSRLVLFASTATLQGMPNLTINDPFPLYSSVYPYSYLATRQKANLMNFSYAYAENRFRISCSGYHQFANCGYNSERHAVNLGDLPNGRWNILGLFYDPPLRDVLFNALCIFPTTSPATAPPQGCENSYAIPADDTLKTGNNCFRTITDPNLVDPNQEFGFFTIPLAYRKYGVRFESEILLIDRCYYAVGLRVQWGISDIRQTVRAFNDLTCQALGIACPATAIRGDQGTNSGPAPTAQAPIAVAPPFVNPLTEPPCPIPGCEPCDNCVTPLQEFQPTETETLALGFDAKCKQFVIENIMGRQDEIARVLGLDIRNYHKVGLDDLRVGLFYRHIFIINEDDERYPRVLFMPFAELIGGIPMAKEIDQRDIFAVPLGNNRFTSVGGQTGFTIDFLDTIDITFAAGFAYFFKRDICNFRLPTNSAESGIFPYSADVTIRPGPTWHANIGIHGYHFLPNCSFWAEYSVVSHTQDDIKVCRSFIPENSNYFETGFDVERAEHFSKWEAHMANFAFNFDLSDNFSIGILFQAPVRQRNVYKSSTLLGTITFVY